MNINKILFFVCFTATINFFASYAQTTDTPDVSQENEYSYGTVININDTDIVLKEYNYEKEEFIETSYKIAPDIKVRNAESVKSITAGNQIEVLYTEKDNIKTVVIMVVEKDQGVAEGPEAEDETTEENTEAVTEPAPET